VRAPLRRFEMGVLFTPVNVLRWPCVDERNHFEAAVEGESIQSDLKCSRCTFTVAKRPSPRQVRRLFGA
jgi:hypothetical protein